MKDEIHIRAYADYTITLSHKDLIEAIAQHIRLKSPRHVADKLPNTVPNNTVFFGSHNSTMQVRATWKIPTKEGE